MMVLGPLGPAFSRECAPVNDALSQSDVRPHPHEDIRSNLIGMPSLFHTGQLDVSQKSIG